MSNLLESRVLLLFAAKSYHKKVGSLLHALKEIYLEKKGTTDQFEILYISMDWNWSRTSFSARVKEIPHLVHAYVPNFAKTLVEKVFGSVPHLPAIAAFGSDGNLQTKESNLLVKKTWSSQYPFIQGDMEEDICNELVYHRNFWNLQNIFPRYPSAN